ncbi:MAG: ABC transporter permease [Thermomicrobiales bacterium]|nr:ABC transporter permease [Thermomicrobiales bacterium]
MTAYILRRLLVMIPLLLGVTFLTFAMINLIPGSPADIVRSDPKIRPEARERIEKQLGLDKPWPVRYVLWLGDLARGNLGYSMYNRVPVADRIGAVLPNTLLLTTSALALALIVAVPLGVYAALRHRSWFDHVATVGAVAMYAMPTFWLALLLVILFSLKFSAWGWPSLPVGGMTDARGGGGFGDRFEHLILPAITLALVQIGAWSSYIRSSMLETLRMDFVRTAHAKGLGERAVLFRHAFRNAFLPLVTLVGLSLPELFGGAVIVESIFAWNGIGRLTIEAVNRRDYTLIMGTTLMFAVLTMVSNLLADVMYATLDPRIRLE